MKKEYNFYLNLFLALILGIFIGIIINSNIDYSIINKPPLAIDGALFPIIWPILYLLIGLSYAIAKKDDNINFLYYLQLILNLLWSIIFFSLKLRFLSILWIIFLDIIVILLFIKYFKNNKYSAYLIIPYIIWLLFATYLNIGVFILN